MYIAQVNGVVINLLGFKDRLADNGIGVAVQLVITDCETHTHALALGNPTGDVIQFRLVFG